MPPYDEIFSYAGYRVEKTPNTFPWLGVGFQLSAEGTVATSVAPDSEGGRAGIAIGDVFVSIDGAPLQPGGPPVMALLQGKIGQTVKVAVRRADEQKIFDVRVAAVELTNYRLIETPNATTEQLRLRDAWLRTSPATR
jgi:C-terminal processing protease CtpA/Prc